MTDKTKKRIKIGIVAAIIVAIGIGFAACHHKTVPEGVSLNYSEEQVDDNYAEGIVCPGWSTMYVEANTKDVTVNLFNPEENKGTDDMSGYNMVFTMTVDGVDVYTSPEVEPGDAITEAHLDAVIPTGQHDCVIHIQPIRQGDGVETNNANMNCTLIAVEQ